MLLEKSLVSGTCLLVVLGFRKRPPSLLLGQSLLQHFLYPTPLPYVLCEPLLYNYMGRRIL